MKVLVTVKETIDYQVKVRLNSDGSDIETQGVQISMNPFDAIAVEAAVSSQEAGLITHSSALHIGSDEKVLQQALAMGIDEGILIESDASDTFMKCQMLADYIENNPVDLIIMGKLAIDGDHGQIPQMLAGMLNWPCATYASNIDIKKDSIEVDREVDSGIERVQLKTPCIISTDLRLNEPRFIALPKLLAAKKKTMTKISPKAFDPSPIQITKRSYPEQKPGCTPTDDLQEFIQQLTDAGVIK